MNLIIFFFSFKLNIDSQNKSVKVVRTHCKFIILLNNISYHYVFVLLKKIAAEMSFSSKKYFKLKGVLKANMYWLLILSTTYENNKSTI